MRVDPFGRSAQTSRRRGFGGIRWWILILFAGYAAWSWFGSAQTDPYTGETAHYGTSAEEEILLGAQAYQQVQSDAAAQGALLPPDAHITRQVREIASRLVNRVPQVTTELAAMNQQQAPTDHHQFQWDVSVIQSDQANAFVRQAFEASISRTVLICILRPDQRAALTVVVRSALDALCTVRTTTQV